MTSDVLPLNGDSGTAFPMGSQQSDSLLRPVDWIKPSVDRRSSFERRLLFENFTIAGFKGLEAELESQFRVAPTDIVCYQLATTLAQCMPTARSLRRADQLLMRATRPGCDLSEALRQNALDVHRSVRAMLAESARSTSGRLKQANWGIYNRCPLVCVGCYNIFNSETLDLQDAKAVVEKLVNAGVEELIVSGGDPLEWEHILEFVDHAHTFGLYVGIDTVGYRLTPEMAKALSGRVSYVGLPLDGGRDDVIADFRKGKSDLFARILHAISLCAAYSIPIKVNTTVTRSNVDDLENIARTLSSFDAVFAWHLFQWWDLRSPRALRERMQIDRSGFQERVLHLQQAYPRLKIASGTIDKRARTHFFISANGEVYTFDSGALSTIIIGDVRTQTIAELVASPALNKDSPKFLRTFPRSHPKQPCIPQHTTSSVGVPRASRTR